MGIGYNIESKILMATENVKQMQLWLFEKSHPGITKLVLRCTALLAAIWWLLGRCPKCDLGDHWVKPNS